MVHTHHSRNVRAVNISIQEPNPGAFLCKRNSQVDGHSRFSYAAFTGCHSYNIMDGQSQQFTDLPI
ncbi:hypothetical protein SDC9_115487 [bioreactor metagenome]|uniref:Uncharacterized protein n=1 Tax=bioreactor metagenome TaxID=1076179 RepID=A0A645C3L9_9ZZZZ